VPRAFRPEGRPRVTRFGNGGRGWRSSRSPKRSTGGAGLVITRRTPTRSDDSISGHPDPVAHVGRRQNRIPPTTSGVARTPRARVRLGAAESRRRARRDRVSVELFGAARVRAPPEHDSGSRDRGRWRAPREHDPAASMRRPRGPRPGVRALAVPEKVGYEVEDVFVIEGGESS